MSGSESKGVELLQAIAHARMYVTSGRGLESVVHKLVHSDLGFISNLLAPALDRMTEGEEALTAVRTLIDREEDQNIRSFLAALAASGAPAVMRLDELSEALHAEREQRADVYGARLTGIIDMTAALFVFAFAPTMLRVLTLIPENDLLPTISIGSWFEWVFYTILAGLLTVLLYSARAR